MKNTISVFYANILSAADESGKSPAEVLAAVSAAGITAVDLDYEMTKKAAPQPAAPLSITPSPCPQGKSAGV